MLPAAAMAQAGWAPGSEVVGQPIQVTTNGVTNIVYLDPGGQLRIMTPGGNTVPGTWTAANGQLCLGTGGVQECVPYTSSVPGRPAGDAHQLVRRERDLACAGDEPGADLKARRPSAAARPLIQAEMVRALRLARGRESLVQSVQRCLVRQVEVKRADRDIAVGDGLEVGRMARSLHHRAEPEPVIIIAPRVGPLDDPQPPVIAQALPAHADALHLFRRQAGKLTLMSVRGSVSSSSSGPSTRSAQTSAAAKGTVSPMPSRE